MSGKVHVPVWFAIADHLSSSSSPITIPLFSPCGEKKKGWVNSKCRGILKKRPPYFLASCFCSWRLCHFLIVIFAIIKLFRVCVLLFFFFFFARWQTDFSVCFQLSFFFFYLHPGNLLSFFFCGWVVETGFLYQRLWSFDCCLRLLFSFFFFCFFPHFSSKRWIKRQVSHWSWLYQCLLMWILLFAIKFFFFLVFRHPFFFAGLFVCFLFVLKSRRLCPFLAAFNVFPVSYSDCSTWFNDCRWKKENKHKHLWTSRLCSSLQTTPATYVLFASSWLTKCAVSEPSEAR